MAKMKKKFSTVFSDKLSEMPMKAPPMNIHLKDIAKPFRITTARQVPLRFKEESDKEVQNYRERDYCQGNRTNNLVCTWVFRPEAGWGESQKGN